MYTNMLKSILIAIVGLIGLLILISVALIIFIDTSVYKPRMERAASDALGMEVRVGGRLGLSALGHKFGDVFYAATFSSCLCSESLARTFFKSSRVNRHSNGTADFSYTA
jgi:hypothetical protein